MTALRRRILSVLALLLAAYFGYWCRELVDINACIDNGGYWNKQHYCEGARPSKLD